LFITGSSYNRGCFSNKDYDALVEASGKKDASDPEKTLGRHGKSRKNY
jgi:oligopeptide transport system substrate-binding protein